MVGALSKGLDDAQDTVLEPLTGVGTDLSVSCPLIVPDEQSGGTGAGDPFSQLSDEEQRQLERENESHDAAFPVGADVVSRTCPAEVNEGVAVAWIL
jgi:hypothetical protein